MRIIYEKKAVLTNTNNEQSVEAEVDNVKVKKSFDAYLAKNKIPMKWNGRVYVGNIHGMEFTSNGPKEIIIKDRV